jgi:hypothetical protein
VAATVATPPVAASPDRLDDLEQRLRALQARVDAIERAIGPA